MGFAKIRLFEQASTTLCWTAEQHNPQMAVNAIAYTLSDTHYPDTVRWCMEELLRTIELHSQCSVDYISDVFTEKYSKMVSLGVPPEDEAMLEITFQAIDVRKMATNIKSSNTRRQVGLSNQTHSDP